MRARALPGGHDRHRRAAGRMPADRRIDGAAPREVARRQREIFAGHRPRLQRAHQRGVRGQGFRDDEQAARVLVQTMDDAGARHVRELRRMMQQRIQQRAVPIAGARVDDEPGRLVHDEQRLVLGDDGKGDRFGQKRRFLRQRFRIDHHAARRRAPAASAPPDGRPASRVRRRSTPGAGRAKIAATRARAPRRSAGRRHRPAASARGSPRWTATRARRRVAVQDGEGTG